MEESSQKAEDGVAAEGLLLGPCLAKLAGRDDTRWDHRVLVAVKGCTWTSSYARKSRSAPLLCSGKLKGSTVTNQGLKSAAGVAFSQSFREELSTSAAFRNR